LTRHDLAARSPLVPVILTIVAIVSIQLGAAIAKTLFSRVGPQGVTAMRLAFASILMLVILRPWRMRVTPAARRNIVLYGAALGGMNLLFYMALRTVPLGIAVALEFSGPLALAMLSSRRPIDFAWIALAGLGILALLPLQGARDIDVTGAIYALGAGTCWALYIFFGQKAGAGRGSEVVAAAMAIAAILVVPIGIAEAGASLFQPSLIVPGLGIAILSSALPYSLEMAAMTRLPAKTFGTLMSLEPAVGALSGLVFLGEYLSLRQWLAIGAIIVASIGATMTIRSKAGVPATA